MLNTRVIIRQEELCTLWGGWLQGVGMDQFNLIPRDLFFSSFLFLSISLLLLLLLLLSHIVCMRKIIVSLLANPHFPLQWVKSM